jgi:hypothetical protein
MEWQTCGAQNAVSSRACGFESHLGHLPFRWPPNSGKVPRLILLAFFLPVAVYLLVLGGVNRRRYPLMVSGVWDFIGILFAASGFLLFGGPAILSSFNDSSRRFWLLGRTVHLEGGWQVWLFFAVLYFVCIIAGSALVLSRQRTLTSIYNAEPSQVVRCLHQIFERLQLNPVRSGNLYLFGLASDSPAPADVPAHEGIQAPHYLPGSGRPDGGGPAPSLGHAGAATGSDFLGQTAILEVEAFASLRHVTLRWDPVDNLFRQEIESQLEQVLAETPTEESEVGSWLIVSGLGLLALVFLGGVLVMLLRSSRIFG